MKLSNAAVVFTILAREIAAKERSWERFFSLQMAVYKPNRVGLILCFISSPAGSHIKLPKAIRGAMQGACRTVM